MVLINLFEHFSIGPVCYTIAAEVPSSRLRARSIAMGRVVFQVNAIIGDQLNSRMVNPTAWNWGAKVGFFHLGTNILCFIWAFFRLPETGGLSFSDLDILFANKVSARRFKDTVIHDEVAEGENRDHEEDFADDKPKEEHREVAVK